MFDNPLYRVPCLSWPHMFDHGEVPSDLLTVRHTAAGWGSPEKSISSVYSKRENEVLRDQEELFPRGNPVHFINKCLQPFQSFFRLWYPKFRHCAVEQRPGAPSALEGKS